MNELDLNLLRVLDAILDTRSVSRAAERVGLSKPATSHALARLRARLGDPVLVRAGKDWKLTDRAEGMRTRVRELAEGVRLVFEREPVFDPATSKREFTIHLTDHMLALIGTGIGHRVAREAPNVKLRFLPILVDDAGPLRSGEVDLALGVFPRLPPEFRTQTLFEERFASVVRKGHPQIKRSISLKTFLEMKHVLVAPRGRPSSVVDDVLAERGLARNVTRYVPYFVVALDLVSRSNCVVTMSERLARMYADRFALSVLRTPIPLPSYTICQVWHPRIDADPGHRWLRQRIANVAAELVGRARRG